MKLTKRQKEILDFIADFMNRHGYCPSMEEIADNFQFASLNAVFKHLEALESRGYLHRDSNRARSIELLSEKASGVRTIPLLGFVAAGRPIEAIPIPETLQIPEAFLPGRGSCYVLRVQGESMIEEHIEDGDYVIVESRETAANGEMVIALIEGENVTLKKFFREGHQVRLQPANRELEPLRLDGTKVKVQGVVVGIMRKYRQ